MRNSFCGLFVALVLFGSGVAAQSFYGTGDVAEFREGREKEFRNRVESPLLNTDFEKFAGLEYYDIDEKYRIKAVFEQTPDETYFLMPTSSGVSAKYKKLGELRFELDGNEFTLNAYQSEKIMTNEEWNRKYGDSLFIPFKDTTNGDTTYAGGRYIYMKIPDSAETVLDFNLAFNPSCAYGSSKYSCPIPPRANRLNVEIRAGEKSFGYTKEQK